MRKQTQVRSKCDQVDDFSFCLFYFFNSCMTFSKMYPVHIMRKFVCDRLTAAAQEILGAFEKRVEDYEAEIARQRRQLDKVFSRETKLQTEIHLSEEKAQLNQHSNNEAGSGFVPDISKIKDEHEEMCISEEQLQHPQQRQTACDPNVSSHHTQPLDPEQQSSANKDPPSHMSNKDGEPEFDREMSAVSAAHQENSREAENQQDVAVDNEGVIGHVESSINDESAALRPEETSAENTLFAGCSDEMPDQINDESTASQVKTKHFSDEGCEDSNPTPANITEPARLEKSNTNGTNLDRSNEPAQIETTASTTNDEQEQNTMRSSDNKTPAGATASTSEGHENIQDDKSALTRSAEHTQSEKSRAWSPGLASNATTDKTSQDGKHGLTQSLEATQTEKSTQTCVEPTSIEKPWDGEPTSTECTEQMPHERSDDKTSSAASTSKVSSKAIATSSKKTELKPKDEKRSKKSSDPATETKPKDQKSLRGKLRSRKQCRDDSKRFNVDSASTSGDDPSEATWEPSNESSDETPIEEGATSSSSSKPAQDKKLRDEGAASARSNKSTQHENVKEETMASTETPIRRLHNRKKASSSKSKHKSSDGSKTSRKSKESSSKRKASSRSKEGTSPKRQNEGRSTDSAQKKRRKDESSTSTTSNEENKPERCSKDSTASNENPEPSSCQRDDTSGNSAEEWENPYKCDTCGKVMSNFKNYKFHMKSHTVEKTFKCNTCGKMFRESWDLNKHSVIHCVEKPFKCDICGNGFNRRYNLDLHARVHTGEKPYKCNTCGKSFSSGVNRKKHTRIHTGEKPYTCKDCTKEFADSSAFKNHLRVHTGEKPFKCTYCKRKFATRTTLKRHTRTHTGEKPYNCTVCDKKFGHKTDLKGHIRMHTGEKPYKCAICEDQFSSWSKLNKHKRVHASEAESSSNKPGMDSKEQKTETA